MPPIKNYRILAIDDDLVFHRHLREQLGQHLEFINVLNEEKLQVVLGQNSGIDLVLLDLVLDENKGVKSGFRVLEKLKTQLPNVPILALTENLPAEIVVEALQRGVKDFLTKPAEPELLNNWDARIRINIEQKKVAPKTEIRVEIEEQAIEEEPSSAILLIDDDESFFRQIRRKFRHNYRITGLHTLEEIENALSAPVDFDLILLDLVLDETKPSDLIGLELIPRLKEAIPGAPIIIVTGYGDINTAVKAMSLGAKDYLPKPSASDNPELWDQRIKQAIENQVVREELVKVKTELQKARESNQYINPALRPFIGRSPQIEQIRRFLKGVSDDPELTVLITGETGVGKGVAAFFLHYNSRSRNKKPFEEIYISNIPKDLVPSELFGAQKGSYTGADADKKGRLEAANGGIVFLDEIGDLDLENQIKLLQFLQNKTIRPIGGLKDIKLDVQIVAATNKNLREEVSKGRFREDLYMRLKVFPIEIPPLRERREDIPLLVAHFLKAKEAELNLVFTDDVRYFLNEECPWLGNVRELENSIRSMQLRAKIEGLRKINMKCVPDELLNSQLPYSSLYQPEPTLGNYTSSLHPLDSRSVLLPSMPTALSFDEQQDWLTLEAIERALVIKNGVKNDVAMMLNFNSADLILYRVKSISKKYPQMVQSFPHICKHYAKAIVKSSNL